MGRVKVDRSNIPRHSCPHGAVECPPCWRERMMSVTLSPAATPSRRLTRSNAPPRRPDPAWERGTPSQRRKDGSQMPYLMPDGSVASMKEYTDNRHIWDRSIRTAHTTANKEE